MRKRWIISSLLVVFLLPVAVISAALVFINATDLSQYRGTIARHISEILGRQLSLDGELDLAIASTSSIVISDITLANAEWASEADMLVIRRIEAEIELLPFLRGEIRIPRFHLDGVKALLETDASGYGNWVLTEPVGDAQAIDDAGKSSPFRLPWIGELFIGNVGFAYRDEQTGSKTTA